jgi:hypothetical protein
LIAEAEALAARAAERETPSRVKELQGRWQSHAKAIALAQRDERTLWERFRAACNAVFDARAGSRKEGEERRQAQRRTLEALCTQLEQLAQSNSADEAQVRSAQRDLQEQWRAAVSDSGPAPAGLDARFKSARASVDELLRGRARASEAAVWQALLAKVWLCEELDVLASLAADPDPAAVDSVRQRWAALAPLSAEWERKVLERRDAALQAMADAYDREDHLAKIEDCAATRRDALLELELMLGIDSPADLQPQRLAVQVKHLRDRFKRTASGGAGSAEQVLIAWCSLPGATETRDRARVERIVGSVGRPR